MRTVCLFKQDLIFHAPLIWLMAIQNYKKQKKERNWIIIIIIYIYIYISSAVIITSCDPNGFQGQYHQLWSSPAVIITSCDHNGFHSLYLNLVHTTNDLRHNIIYLVFLNKSGLVPRIVVYIFFPIELQIYDHAFVITKEGNMEKRPMFSFSGGNQ